MVGTIDTAWLGHETPYGGDIRHHMQCKKKQSFYEKIQRRSIILERKHEEM